MRSKASPGTNRMAAAAAGGCLGIADETLLLQPKGSHIQLVFNI